MLDITKVPEINITYSNHIPPSERIQVRGSEQVAELMCKWWDKVAPGTRDYVESFAVLLLNQANHVLGAKCVARGGTTGTVCDVKVLAQHAIKANASYIILCHNHPSGRINPSKIDVSTTMQVIAAMKLLEIKVLDHLIITGDPEQWYSMADNNDIPDPND